MKNFVKHLSAFIILVYANNSAFTQSEPDSIIQIQKRIEQLISNNQVSAQLFLGYQYFNNVGEDFNEFAIKRGYITFRKRVNPYISGRITPDITIDREGDGEGDVEMRLKYIFAQFTNPNMQGFITEPSILIGQVYTPFIEFEEKINPYRVVSSHFLDRVNQVSSADFGITLTTLIGGKIDDDYQKRINKNHAGKYGSIALGIYNGGGYHALEKNNNKTFQWRYTVRPFPKFIPGFQASFTGALGKGNLAEAPDWNLYAGFLSYEHEHFVVTGQYFNAKGDHSGKLTNVSMLPLDNHGYSIFSEIKLFKKKASLFGVWDYSEISDVNTISTSRYIVGLAYHIQGKTKIVVDYNFRDNSNNHPNPDLG
ncbi:MAG: hypothetical protein CVT98_04215, partial [Bacteroidetes bacterium HGW-Bacteroidetes-15]